MVVQQSGDLGAQVGKVFLDGCRLPDFGVDLRLLSSENAALLGDRGSFRGGFGNGGCSEYVELGMRFRAIGLQRRGYQPVDVFSDAPAQCIELEQLRIACCRRSTLPDLVLLVLKRT
jgi:hypothetical protein